MHQNQHVFQLFLHSVGEDPVPLEKFFKKEKEVDFYTVSLQILDHYVPMNGATKSEPETVPVISATH